MKHSQKINLFHTIEEAEEFNAYQVFIQSPKDRIRETVQLILRIYSVKKKISSNKINFD
jgi:hypothetical protein